MAEYIDVKDVEKLIEYAIEDSWELDYTLEKLKEINKADVIERSKIDNALADMQLMLDQEVLNDNVISDVGQGIAIAMGLLRTNIGE